MSAMSSSRPNAPSHQQSSGRQASHQQSSSMGGKRGIIDPETLYVRQERIGKSSAKYNFSGAKQSGAMPDLLEIQVKEVSVKSIKGEQSVRRACFRKQH
jgi:hypothetical protein